MFAPTLALLLGALGASALLVPSDSSEPVNATIPIYTDPVLAAVAADPPTSASQASVAFTNGLRALPGAYFNFTESAGLTSANLTVTELVFAVPANLSTTNNLFVYHVHEFPIADGDESCKSAGGHYDPFQANGTQGLVNATEGARNPLYHPAPGNLSTYQVGDLSGKWGSLTTLDGSIPQRAIFEHYLRLTGTYSILGRSIVIHDAPTDTRIACGNITSASFASNSTSGNSTSGSGSSGAGATSASFVGPLAVALGALLLAL